MRAAMTRTLLLAAAVVLLPVTVLAAEPAKAVEAKAADAVATIPVGGMTCGGCVSNVTGKLQAIPGVKAVDVNLEKKRARVTYEASRVTPKALVDAIRDAGFEPGEPSVQ